MNLPLSIVADPGRVAHSRREVVRLMDTLKDEAALELDAALDGASSKRLDRAAVPGAGRTGLARARHGSASNPLYRIVGVFVLMKRLGMGRERAQRIVNWLQEIVDALWPEESAPPLEEVLREEQRHDSEEDRHQVDALTGVPGATAALLESVRRRHAYDRVVLLALRRRLAEQG